MKSLSSLLSVFLLVSMQAVNAQNADIDLLPEKKLADYLARLTTYEAGFEQTVTEDDGYVLDENTGVMSFERPSKLYWKVLKPFPTLLVSDGNKIYFYDPDLDQVRVRNWSSNPSENPVAVFIGEAAISDYYDVSELNGAFLLRPKEADSGFSDIQIEFGKNAIKNMRIADSLGQITNIRFTAIEEKTEEIPKTPYEFSIPATAEVIDDS